MAEVLVTFSDTITGDSVPYRARACGREMDDGRWEGWIEFEALDGSTVLRSGRETTQPNRIDTEYWATGLTPVYLEGALDRALQTTAELNRLSTPELIELIVATVRVRETESVPRESF